MKFRSIVLGCVIAVLIFAMFLVGCAGQQPQTVVFVPETIEDQEQYFQQITLQMIQILQENAQIRQKYYILWMSLMLRGIQQNQNGSELNELPK